MVREPLRESSESAAAVAAVVAIAVVIILMAAGATMFVWQRQAVLVQQAALEQAERARAEAARTRAALAHKTKRNAATPNESTKQSDMADDTESVDRSIRTILAAQQRAWNDGDIDQFMEYYWKSDDLTFSSGGELTRTWQGTLESYKERYPSHRDMGKLSFQNLEVTPLGGGSALVLGKWRVTRDSEPLRGNFTLVFRYFSDGWVIVHDHTSRAAEESKH